MAEANKRPDRAEGGETYRVVPLAMAKAGMTLEQNVFDQSGRMIIAQGTRLTPMLLSRLSKWNIKEIYIPASEAAALAAEAGEGEPASLRDGGKGTSRVLVVGDAGSEAALLALQALERELDDRFAGTTERLAMKWLREAAWRVLSRAGAEPLPGRDRHDA